MKPIKLIACIGMTVPEEVMVGETGRPPDRLDGYTSHDQQVGTVRSFLNSRGLPWSEHFVSVLVLLPEDETTSLHEAFGYCFELDTDAVLPHLEVVCSDDIQNCAANHRESEVQC